tara:strand:- start:1233 stop:1646 length:414 start_codon:yes stop_codon:yes gene_type:complete
MARNTQTGKVMEDMMLHALKFGGYTIETQVRIGERLGGGRHFADFIASNGNDRIIISAKWQQTSGTAEQKVPYEYMCLAHAVNSVEDVDYAYIVIGGTGWTKHSFFLNGLADWVNSDANIRVVRLDEFVGLANNSKL